MTFNKDFLMGFLSGTVVGAVGYRVYEQNGAQLQRLIQPNQHVPLSFNGGAVRQEPTIEQLMEQKERLEDLIAEKSVINSKS
ncbi:hypothetical protein [Bacillus taeanensis]|uniref:Uncharacterized protein n=1 Tax=Bacillus taeanensis TaxID=273032 RepID=A0A366XS90_9BACI|nr:hypothetical protein [Bacillus taeanensis]RBW68757.1 hypothetical protein DS031_14520 [Bacillus taeanensis]